MTDTHRSAETEPEIENQVMGGVETMRGCRYQSTESFRNIQKFLTITKRILHRFLIILFEVRPCLASLTLRPSDLYVGHLLEIPSDGITWRCFKLTKASNLLFCFASIRSTLQKGPSPLYALFNFDSDQVNR